MASLALRGVQRSLPYTPIRVEIARAPVVKDRRHAITPAQAILSYLYRLLEAETTLSLHASDLDPALGVFHRDERYRDSLSLDVMEAGRPVVDAYLHRTLEVQRLRRSDFHESDRGVVRLLPPLTHRLAEPLPRLRDAVEPVSLSHLARSTGLSRRYIKLVASGANVPHPMHWDALRVASSAL